MKIPFEIVPVNEVSKLLPCLRCANGARGQEASGCIALEKRRTVSQDNAYLPIRETKLTTLPKNV